jgi:hypothetical protein
MRNNSDNCDPQQSLGGDLKSLFSFLLKMFISDYFVFLNYHILLVND